MPETTLLTHFYLKLGGADGSEELMNDLVNVEVDDSLHIPDMFTLRVRDPRLNWVDSAQFAFGQEVEILAQGLGEGRASPQRLLVGEITSVEPAYPYGDVPTLTVRGYDRAHRLHRGRKTRTFQQVTDGDVVTKIAREYGLRPDVDSTSEVHPYLLQNNQSDFEFILERARRLGFNFLVDNNALVFKKPGHLPGETVELEYGTTLREFRPRLSTASQFKEVVVKGWDPANKREITGRAGGGRSRDAAEVAQVNAELGSAAVQKAFGEAGTLVVTQHPVRSRAEADALAQSIFAELTGGNVQAEGVAIGNPKISAGCKVKLDALGDRFNGEYFVTHTRHTYDAEEGYLTEFTISGRNPDTFVDLLFGGAGSNPGMTGNGAPAGVIVGLVTNNKDPEGRGRVKVMLPALLGEETYWARLASPMAGKDRGLFILPEVNDEVLVVFEHGDVNYPYVVGALWNGSDTPPLAADDAVDGGGSVVRRAWKTRAGHVITLDDSDDSPGIRIVDKTGNNKILIDSKAGGLTVELDGDVTLKAGGKVKVEAGGDVGIEARGGLSLKAASDIGIEATGSVKIRGATVELN